MTLTIVNSGTAFLETQRFSSTVLVSGSGNVKGKTLAGSEPACVTPSQDTPLWRLRPGKLCRELCYRGWHLLPEKPQLLSPVQINMLTLVPLWHLVLCALTLRSITEMRLWGLAFWWRQHSIIIHDISLAVSSFTLFCPRPNKEFSCSFTREGICLPTGLSSMKPMSHEFVTQVLTKAYQKMHEKMMKSLSKIYFIEED